MGYKSNLTVASTDLFLNCYFQFGTVLCYNTPLRRPLKAHYKYSAKESTFFQQKKSLKLHLFIAFKHIIRIRKLQLFCLLKYMHMPIKLRKRKKGDTLSLSIIQMWKSHHKAETNLNLKMH